LELKQDIRSMCDMMYGMMYLLIVSHIE